MARFSQWFLLDIEVTGSPRAREKLAEAVEAQGWLVSSTDDAVGDPNRSRWVVEAGVPGSRSSAAAAVRTVLGRLEARLPVVADLRTSDLILRQELPRGRYAVHRPPRLPHRLRRLEPLLVRTGLYDTGRELLMVPGADVEQRAAAEAVRELPGGSTPPADGRPRRIGPEANRVPPPRGPRSARRTSSPWLAFLTVLLLLGGIRLGAVDRSSAWAWVAMALLVVLVGISFGVNYVSLWEHSATDSRLRRGSAGLVVAVLIGGLAVGIGAGGSVRLWQGVLITALLWAMGNGIRLLIRDLTWQTTAAWLVPALLPIALVLLPVFGISLHVFYLDAFGLDREAVAIPAAWNVIADLKALAVLAGPLAAASLLGYARHFQQFRTPGGPAIVLTVVAVGFSVTVALFQMQIMTGPAQAAARAQQQARDGRQPARYFGIAPRRVCLRPVGEGAWDGAAPVAEDPYLVFPAVGDWASLWDVRTGTTVVVKREQYRISDSTAPAC